MWKAEGGKLIGTPTSTVCFIRRAWGTQPFPYLIGFVGETATFIAECAEDDNDSVVQGAHRLKDAVESVAGSISGL